MLLFPTSAVHIVMFISNQTAFVAVDAISFGEGNGFARAVTRNAVEASKMAVSFENEVVKRSAELPIIELRLRVSE
jgi:hypothetical protein